MNRPTEFVNFRVAAIGVTDKAQVRAAFDPESAFPSERRSLIFDGRLLDTPVHHRGSLPSGWTVGAPLSSRNRCHHHPSSWLGCRGTRLRLPVHSSRLRRTYADPEPRPRRGSTPPSLLRLRHVVFDFTRHLSGPFATMLLHDLGAEVIKFESPAGDPARRMGPFSGADSAYFHPVNRGKRSVVADLRSPADVAAILRLARFADGFTENFRPG